MESGIAGQGGVGEKLAFQLIRGLVRNQEQQRRPIGRGGKRGADFRQAAEGLAAARRAQDEARMHPKVLSTNNR